MCQQEYVVHADAQRQERQHLEGHGAGIEDLSSSGPKSALKTWPTWVVAALEGNAQQGTRAPGPVPPPGHQQQFPSEAQTAPGDWAQSHRSIVTQA